jgi:hypothetical protein
MMRLTLLALSICLAAPALAAPHQGKGTDVLHLTLRTALLGTEAPPDAGTMGPDPSGEVKLMLRQQGAADIQRFELDVSGLEPDATYHLFALLRGQMALIEVLTFDTDENGDASEKRMKGQVPQQMDPLVDVLALEVRDDMDQTVLDVDLGAPDFLQYLVKRKLENDGVDVDAAGALFLKSNGDKTQFRLKASGLAPNADYALVIDGIALATLTTDEDGTLEARELPDGAPDALAIESIELHDGADMSVLSAQLP